jgi:DNA-binding transcriptional regulator YiaG
MQDMARQATQKPVTSTTSQVLGVEQTLADKLVERADPSDVKQLCDRYGLRREDLGRLTGFSLRALADWSAGKLPSEPARRRLHEIRRLLDSLGQLVKVNAISSWLKTRNPAFENMTPMQVIEVGEIDRLWQMVYALGSDSLE